jgi:putative ABC transport system permease protein
MIIKRLADMSNVAKLAPLHAIALIVISVFLALVAGLIPARLASKKDPVVALRTE